MDRLGFQGLDIRLNPVGSALSRKPYRKLLLDAIRDNSSEISPDAMDRYANNPMRIFDSKDYGDNLKGSLPVISDHLAGEDLEHFQRVRELLDATGVTCTSDPYLVRGLDYYTRTVFEVYHGEHGAQSALCGGGRYDALVEECGGPSTPAIGFSAGLERIIAALPAAGDRVGGPGEVRFYVVCADDDAAPRALRAAGVLRRLGNTEIDLSGRSRKKQLQAAEKKQARYAIVADSQSAERLTIRDIAERRDEEIGEDALAAFFKDEDMNRKEPR
jgi:histidyl-tRNA synthetase